MSHVLCNSEYLQLKSTPSKNGKPWVYAHRPNVSDVAVILTTYNDEVLFLIEERPPLQAEKVGKYAVGMPAGLVGDVRENETFEDAVRAELLEEAGLEAEKIIINARNIASSAGCVSETFTIATAIFKTKEYKQLPISDDGVIVDRVWVKKDNIKLWLKEMELKGYILTAQSLAALYFMEK